MIADALRKTDPAGALGAEQETNWRSGYLTHFRRVIEAGLSSRQSALAIATDGLGSLRSRMRSVRPGGEETELDDLLRRQAVRRLGTATIKGTGESETELALPYRGERLRGDDLARRLDAWVTAGIIEPSCADAVREVAAHPEWLRLPGRTVAVLGAGSEVGPLPVLLRWGATVAGIDLPQPRIWERVLTTARVERGNAAATRRRGYRKRRPEASQSAQPPDGELTATAGADLTSEVPEHRRLDRRPERPARPRQLCLRRRRRERAGLRGRRHAHAPAPGRPRRRRARVPRDAQPTSSRCPARPWRTRRRPTRTGRQFSNWPVGRCARCPAAGC